MNVTGKARIPQYEVERSIRAVKAAAEQRQNEQTANQVRNVERAEAAPVIQSPAARDAETLTLQGGGRVPRVDAYIPRSPRAHIEDEDASRPAAPMPAAGRVENIPVSDGKAQGAAEVVEGTQNTQRTEAAQDAQRTEGAEVAQKPQRAETARGIPQAREEAKRELEAADAIPGQTRETVDAIPGQKEEDIADITFPGQKEETEAAYNLHGQKEDAETAYAPSVQKEDGGDEKTDRAERESKATVNTDKINKEIIRLKTELDHLQRMVQMERNPQKAEKLEKQAVQIRRELLWKNSPAYRRQEALPSIA